MADTYVLIHGAWHDGSGWTDVADRIRAEGHTVHTPTLAGNGHGDDIDRTIGHDVATASAVAYIEQNELSDIVLVGHSYGGTIISAVPRRSARGSSGSSTGTPSCCSTASRSTTSARPTTRT